MKPSGSLLVLLMGVSLLGASGRANANPASASQPAAKIQAPAQSQVMWRTPLAPYPVQAKIFHEGGTVMLRLFTDAKGKVVKVYLLHCPDETTSASIKDAAVKWVISRWSGPPNAMKTITMVFRAE